MSSALSLPNHTFFLGRLGPVTSQPVLFTFFHLKLTTALLESTEGRECPKKIFHDQYLRKNVAGPVEDRTRDLLITSRTRIRLSLRGRRNYASAHSNQGPRCSLLKFPILNFPTKTFYTTVVLHFHKITNANYS